MSTRLTPSEPFPEHLVPLDVPEVEVLNSKLERELTHEYVRDGEPDPETEFRHEEVTEELDRRDAVETGAPTAPLLHVVHPPVEAARRSS
ncbi:hypothetical protein [Arthrobacter cheniae]|uniref:hypothetical protein n=1 Tax=Arthrobacter cheniae TaxID=1258888 RepID=UPI0015FF3EAC|nr:hypothetical protein [Arthrobacter cheniae]